MRINLCALFAALIMAGPVLAYITNPPAAIVKRALETLSVPLPPSHRTRLTKRSPSLQRGRGVPARLEGGEDGETSNGEVQFTPAEVTSYITKQVRKLSFEISKIRKKLEYQKQKNTVAESKYVKKGKERKKVDKLAKERKAIAKLEKKMRENLIQLEVFKRASGEGGGEESEGKDAGVEEGEDGFGGRMRGEDIKGADAYGDDQQGPPAGDTGDMGGIGGMTQR